MQRRKGHFLYIKDRDNLTAIGAKLHDTKYELYGFNDDLIETINY